jgi:hypothetical protein
MADKAKVQGRGRRTSHIHTRTPRNTPLPLCLSLAVGQGALYIGCGNHPGKYRAEGAR